MAYAVTIKKSAIKSIGKFDANTKERIATALRELGDNPRPRGSRKIEGCTDTWRVRVGVIRIVYEIRDDTLTVDVIRIAHRSDVYHNLF